MYQYPIVVIHWDDAVDHGDGENVPLHAPAKQVCIGWLLKQDETGVSIAFEYGENNSWRNETFIPAGMITQIDLLDNARKV